MEYPHHGYATGGTRSFDAALIALRERAEHIRGTRLLLELDAEADRAHQQKIRVGKDDARDWDDADRERYWPVVQKHQEDIHAIKALDQLAGRTQSMLDAIALSATQRQKYLRDQKEAQKQIDDARWALEHRRLDALQQQDAWWALRDGQIRNAQAQTELCRLASDMSERIFRELSDPRLQAVSPSTEAAMKQLRKKLQNIKNHYDKQKIIKEIGDETTRTRKQNQGIGRPGGGHSRGGV